jgi:hypothetical protein
VEAHLREHFLYLVERLAPEICVRNISASVFCMRSPTKKPGDLGWQRIAIAAEAIEP